MGFLKNLRQGIEAARNFDPATLPPEQRAEYEKAMAQSQAAQEQAYAINRQARILEGPAGDHLHGPGLVPGTIPGGGDWVGEFKKNVKQSFGRDVGPAQETDPAARQQIAAAEREARSQARAPYRAPDARPIEIARIPTRGKTQVEEVTAFLAASGFAPERVFGCYRVPDRISQTLTVHSEKGRVVEWDVVHVAGPGPALSAPRATTFSAREQWVARQIGEPSILDEDLGVAFLEAAGIGPDRCLGLARYSEFRSFRGTDSEGHNPIQTIVTGLVALHPDDATAAYEQGRARAPLPVRASSKVVYEVLNWEAVASVVHPRVNHPPPVPSPFAYLPSTPQELLRAYLEVVGVRPQDCYSAQATVDAARDLVDGGFMTTNVGPKQPCADGKERMRSHGCEQVVIVYRDAPTYAEGRERWARYSRDVLQADLRKGMHLRGPVADPDHLRGLAPGLKQIVKVAEVAGSIWDFEWGEEELPPHRYCWPPIIS